MIHIRRCLMSLVFICCAAGSICCAADEPPKTCPTQFNPGSFTKGNFFNNFDNNCYEIAFGSGHGASAWGDLDSEYNKIFFRIDPTLPPYQLIIIGKFPNARYFSITVTDDHSAISQSLTDASIVPLQSNQVNPYLPGVPYTPGQRYAVPINLGGTPGALQRGCTMNGYNVDVNALDGTLRHPFMNWNLDTAFLLANPTAPLHNVDTPEHSNPNTAGSITIRNYLDLTSNTAANQPHIIVRDVASGCAYPASMVTAMNILVVNSTTGSAWLDQVQTSEHNTYANWQSTQCWGSVPSSSLQVARGAEYLPVPNPDASYLYAYLPSGLPQSLATSGEVMRLQFRAPTTPPTPCTNGCSRSGSEQMRYVSVSFALPAGTTLASLPDSCPANPLSPCTPLVEDPNGYVSLIVGTGAARPAWVTPANGYTWVDLTQSSTGNYLKMNQIMMRNILPASSFGCAGQRVPYKTDQATAGGGGLMGLYAPVIDYPVASSLPQTASPLTGDDSCAMFPAGPGKFLLPATSSRRTFPRSRPSPRNVPRPVATASWRSPTRLSVFCPPWAALEAFLPDYRIPALRISSRF